jgi:hypothetical protein
MPPSLLASPIRTRRNNLSSSVADEPSTPPHVSNSNSNSSFSDDSSLLVSPLVTSAPMDGILVQELANFLGSMQWTAREFIEFLLLQSPMALDHSLHRLSILLLVLERLQRPFFHDVFIASTALAPAGTDSSSNGSPSHSKKVFSFFPTRTAATAVPGGGGGYGDAYYETTSHYIQDHTHVMGLLFISMVFLLWTTRASGASSSVSSSVLLTTPTTTARTSTASSTTSNDTSTITSNSTQTSTNAHQDVMIVMTLLFSIICLESFLPLILWGTVSLVLYRNICWETTLSILVITWLGGALGYGSCSTVSFVGSINAIIADFSSVGAMSRIVEG